MPTIKSEGLMSKNSNLTPVLTEIIINWHEKAKERGYPALELDDNWPSPCAQSNSEGTFWQPVLQSDHTSSKKSFDNVGEAFEIEINQQYSDLFTLYFSDNLNALLRILFRCVMLQFPFQFREFRRLYLPS